MWILIKLYVVSMAVIIALDFLWLGIIMSKFYKSELGPLARRAGDSLAPIWWAAGVVYLLLPLGILAFVLPAVDPSSPALSSLRLGFLFGAVVYGVYEFTNYSTLANWPISLVTADTIWGGVLCALAALAAQSLRAYLS